jgi:hypothetical protein
MSCEKYLEMISEEVDAELKESDSLFLMRHLVLCRDCRNEYRDSLKLKDLLSEELSFSPVFVPTGFSTKIIDIIEKAPVEAAEAPALPEKKRGGLTDLIGNLRPLFPVQVPSFALPLAASLLIAVSVAFYYTTSPQDINSGYALTDAKNIDAKIIKTASLPLNGGEEDEFGYYAKKHVSAAHRTSSNISIGSRRSGIIYAGYPASGNGPR